jgi:tRNA-Thr(GGU) m(6)t(6)A37 methyltransferase TsaA
MKPKASAAATYTLLPIGIVRSELAAIRDAPNFYTEGAPPAVIEVNPVYERGLSRMKVGDEIIVITWLHRARRNVLRVRPEDDPAQPITGVFSTRSPGRPNPLGLHRVKVLDIRGCRIRIGPIEVVDETPVLDIKPAVAEADDS